jgi:lipoprotein NlpI
MQVLNYVGGAFVRHCAITLSFLGWAAMGAEPADGLDESLQKAKAAYRAGKAVEALAMADKAVTANPKAPQAWFFRGQLHTAMRDHSKALTDFDQVLKLDPGSVSAYQERGAVHFRAGHIKESITDFDKFLDLVPAQAPHHWQRGISLYYAGRFEDGRKQFELHQTVNPSDVENAVWHFLCVARASGLEKARQALIAIEGDSRVPMKEVHALFADKAKPADVLAAAEAGNPSPATLKMQRFYAYLYLGLYYEAAGKNELAKDNIFKSASLADANNYMGDVARVHAAILRRGAGAK